MENGAGTEVLDSSLTAMTELLDEQGGLYDRLLGLAQRKRKVLISGELGELEAVLGEEQSILKRIARLEEERYALQCDLAGQFGFKPGELTVSKLAELAGPVHGHRLRRCQQVLVGLIGELSAVNQCNSELIQQSLAYVNYAMDALVNGVGQTYGESGKRERGQMLRLFNKRA